MDATARTSQICSKAKCKAVLPSEIPGQKVFKTCEKCRNGDAARRKRKRDEKDQGEGRAAPSPPTQERGGLRDTQPKENPRTQSDEESDIEDENVSIYH